MKYILILLLVIIATSMLHADKICMKLDDETVVCWDDDGQEEYIYTLGRLK